MSQLLEIVPSAESRHELLTWLNTTMPPAAPNGSTVAPMHKVEQCGNGVPYVVIAANILPIVYAPLTSASSSKMKIPAQHDFEAVANLKLLQDALQRNSIARPEVLTNEMPKLIKGNFQANLQMLQWFKGLYDTLLSREAVAPAHSDTAPMTNSNMKSTHLGTHKKAYAAAHTQPSSSSSSAGVTATSNSVNPSATRRTPASQPHTLSQLSAAVQSSYGGVTRDDRAGGAVSLTAGALSRERATPVRASQHTSATAPTTTQAVGAGAATTHATHVRATNQTNHPMTAADVVAHANAIPHSAPLDSPASSASWMCAPAGTSSARDRLLMQEDDMADAWRECETINAQGNAATAAAMEILYPQQQQHSHHADGQTVVDGGRRNDRDGLDGCGAAHGLSSKDALAYHVMQTGLADGIMQGDDGGCIFAHDHGQAEQQQQQENTTRPINSSHLYHSRAHDSRAAMRSAQGTPLVHATGSRAPSSHTISPSSAPYSHRHALLDATEDGSAEAVRPPPSALRSRATRLRMLQEASDRRRAGTPVLPHAPSHPPSHTGARIGAEEMGDEAAAAAMSRAPSRRDGVVSRAWTESSSRALSRQPTPSQSFMVSSSSRAPVRGGRGGVAAARGAASSLASSFASRPVTGQVHREAALIHPRANRPFIHKSDVPHSNLPNNTDTTLSTNNNNNNNSDHNDTNEDMPGSVSENQTNAHVSTTPSRTLHHDPTRIAGTATSGHSTMSSVPAAATSKRGSSTPLLTSTGAMRRSGAVATGSTATASAARTATLRSRMGLTAASTVHRVAAKPALSLSNASTLQTNTHSASAAARGFARTHPAGTTASAAGVTRAASALPSTRHRGVVGSRTRELGYGVVGSRSAARSVRQSLPSSVMGYSSSSLSGSGAATTTAATTTTNTPLLRPAGALTMAALSAPAGGGIAMSGRTDLHRASPMSSLPQASPSPAARVPPAGGRVTGANDAGRRAICASSPDAAEEEKACRMRIEGTKESNAALAVDSVARRLSTERARMSSTPRGVPHAMNNPSSSSLLLSSTANGAATRRSVGGAEDDETVTADDAAVVARERQFYYDKLREIELILAPYMTRDGNKTRAGAPGSVDHLIDSISSVLYREY